MGEKSSGNTKKDAVLVIHNIRSVHNVGALFRTADAVGISHIIISGYSPTPTDRFGRPRTDFSKAALGSEKTMSWNYVKSPTAKIKKLKQDGYSIIGIEQDVRAIDYKKMKSVAKMVFVLGTETTGMTPALRNQCDTLLEIPMRGMKESLNVSVAAGIVLYRLLDK